jgi:hypothetical protein
VELGVLVVVGDRRRGYVVGPAPEHELLLAVRVQGLLLVLGLERAVVPLVEPPAAPHRDPQPVGGAERQLGGADRAPQHRRVYHVRQQVLVAQQLAAPAGLVLAPRRQVHVDPAGEQVLRVPLALAVAEQHEGTDGHAVTSLRSVPS